MDTKITTVNWQKPHALDSTPVIFDIPYKKVHIFPVIRDIQSNHSFLHPHKFKQSIIESKKAFLNFSLNEQKPEDEQMEEKSLILGQLDGKRSLSKKISFKIKKQASVYKRNIGTPRVTNIPTNKVTELTKKFNDMVEEQQKMILKRKESMCSEIEKAKKPLMALAHKDSLKVSRKPSVKTKPLLESKNLVIIKTKPTRKTSIKKQNSDNARVYAKIGHNEKLQTVVKPNEQIPRPTTLSLNLNIPKAIIETSPNGTSVRAAIEIFERKSVISSPTKSDSKDILNNVFKPKIPNKTSALRNISKTATLPVSFKVPKNGYTKIYKDNDELVKQTQVNNVSTDNNKNSKAEFEEDKVQIINIPAVLPQRRCDSMYETLNLKKISPQAIKSKSVDNINKDIKSMHSSSVEPNSSFLWKIKSPSISSSSTWINDNVDESIKNIYLSENGKKLPPDIPFKPAIDLIKPVTPPKILKKKMQLPVSPKFLKKEVSEIDLADYEEIGGNIPVILNDLKDIGSDEIILNDEKFKGYDEIIKPVNDVEIMTSKTTNLPIKHYEEIKKCLDAEKSIELNTSKNNYEEINTGEKIYEELVSVATKNDDGYEPIGNKLEHEIYERCSSPETENIYETLPVPQVLLRRQQQEPLPPRPPSSTKNEETFYNCYESIYTETKKDCFYESIYGSQLTDTGSNRDSVLSSDHKSNSLYGKSLPIWDYNSDATYYKPPSDTSCSDRISNRSDEWEDVTDNDEDDNRIIM